MVKPNHSEAEKAEDAFKSMEKHMGTFRAAEKRNDVKEMTDSIIAVCGAVAAVRKAYQPGFPLPTFAEISRVVQANGAKIWIALLRKATGWSILTTKRDS